MKHKIITIICLTILPVLSCFSQKHLAINEVFEKYGKRDGSTLVQLSSDILSKGSNITIYKSLIIEESPFIEKDILNSLKMDIANNLILAEAKKNGVIESGSYYLGGYKSGKASEFILYKKKAKKITLVYLQGDFPPKNLDYELRKLKDLFLYINNKRIKL